MVFLSLSLAALAQLLNLIDPVIFGEIINQYGNHPPSVPTNQLIRGALYWLLLALKSALIHCAGK